jgi:hypothetical protein
VRGKINVPPRSPDRVDESIMNERAKRKYQVAFSFAGEEREYVGKIASILKDRGISVFYDQFEEEVLWGKNLYDYLRDIYCNAAEYTVIFISKSYAEKAWTNHERESAQIRALKENREYILPIRMDSTILPGLSETTGYISAERKSPEDIARIIIRKIGFGSNEVDQQLVSYAARLRNEFRASTRDIENASHLDFSKVNEVLEAMFDLDEINGHALYYSGEVKRFLNRDDRLSMGYLRSHEYFTTYLANARRLSPEEVSESYDQNAEECYKSARGYCDSRTAWIFHLMAHDFYAFANNKRTELEEQEFMVLAYEHAMAAQRIFRNKVSVTFHFASTNQMIEEIKRRLGPQLETRYKPSLYGF